MTTSTDHLITESDLSLRHLKAELARVDILIRREVRRWQRAGQDASDAFRGLYVSESEADGLLEQPFGGNWGAMSGLSPEEVREFAQAEAQAVQGVQILIEMARRQGSSLRLEQLATVFDLDRFDVDTLLVCLAPTLDLRYERLYSYLQNDVTRRRPTVNLVLDLLCGPGTDRLQMLSHFSDDASLLQHSLLEKGSEPGLDSGPLLSHTLAVDRAVVAWLLGRYQPHADLGPHARLSWPLEDKADRLLAADRCDGLLRNTLEAEREGRERLVAFEAANDLPLLVFCGPDRVSQMAAARLLAAHARRPLLTVDMALVTQAGVPPLRALRLALRDARLTGAVPCLTGWDACLASREGEQGAPLPQLLAELCAFPDWAILVGEIPWRPTGVERVRPFFQLEFPIPTYDQRRALWLHYLDAKTPNAFETSEDSKAFKITDLAGQFALTSGQIRDAVASARDVAAQAGRPLQNQDLLAAARAHSNPHLSTLAHKIEPRYDWEDIILPQDQLSLLREIVATVRERPLVLEAWGVGRKLASSGGVTVLFSGPPGTGKTMAAEIMAAELGLDLYKIDLSTVVSKYIGETEKNLERIFNEAQSSNAILFFDEADAIFGKRSEVKDAHDRYANIEVSYLLQRMERYDGVTILATNLRANLDEAFTRRLQFAVDFPFPDEGYRRRIWETLFPADVPREKQLDFGLLASHFKLAGGNIRNIIVSAAYLAASDGGRVTMAHLLHGTRRELQKMGRLVDETDIVFGDNHAK